MLERRDGEKSLEQMTSLKFLITKNLFTLRIFIVAELLSP